MTVAARLPADEQQRLTALRAYQILDTPPEAAFDRLTKIASHLLGTPIALVSLVDSQRQWFKAKVGLDAEQTPREWAFCAHAILNRDEPLVVPDAAFDVRFCNNPLVTEQPKIRFYAGAPIVTRDGLALGTVCAMDQKPRTDIGARETAMLKELAAIAADELELRLLARQLHEEMRRREAAETQVLSAEIARARAETEAVRQRAADSLVRLTGGVAHEFNNLFTGTILLAESVRDRADIPAPVQGAMDALLKAFQRGARLTQGMLSYSGRQMLMPQAVALGPTLESAAEMIRAAHGRAVEIAVTVAADCAAVEIDRGQLLAALAELVANAREAADDRAPTRVTLTAANATLDRGPTKAPTPGAKPGRFVRILVTDDGPGMAPDVRDKACEPFFTTKTVGDGPGLGLSMAQGFARQSGGFLSLDSRPGDGTTVALYLPAAAAP